MEKIQNKTFSKERELYNSKNTVIFNCVFEGKEDGESPLKESSNIVVDNCSFSLRYALWHIKNLEFRNSEIKNNCRAPFWYCRNIKISNSKINGVKSLRECKNVVMNDSNIISSEFGWKCSELDF